MEVSNAHCIQGNVIGRKDCNGPRGGGWNVEVSFTLNCTDIHVVSYEVNFPDPKERVCLT